MSQRVFEHLAVADASGPHVTMTAGIELAGRYWSTTAATAAKVRAIRAGSPAAVLQHRADGWSLWLGSATVLDVRRPWDGLADPVAAGLAGVALARVGLAHRDQLMGYLRDGDAVPAPWRAAGRVLLVVNPEHRLRCRAGVLDGTAHFARPGPLAPATRRRTRRVDAGLLAGLPARSRDLVTTPGPCTLGLATAVGPVVVPAHWDPRGTVVVDRDVLRHVHALLPGRCAVTLDDSDDPEPTAKHGVMLRGDGALLASTGAETANVAIRAERAIAWHGFEVTTLRAS